jgi:hypothetical protein
MLTEQGMLEVLYSHPKEVNRGRLLSLQRNPRYLRYELSEGGEHEAAETIRGMIELPGSQFTQEPVCEKWYKNECEAVPVGQSKPLIRDRGMPTRLAVALRSIWNFDPTERIDEEKTLAYLDCLRELNFLLAGKPIVWDCSKRAPHNVSIRSLLDEIYGSSRRNPWDYSVMFTEGEGFECVRQKDPTDEVQRWWYWHRYPIFKGCQRITVEVDRTRHYKPKRQG